MILAQGKAKRHPGYQNRFSITRCKRKRMGGSSFASSRRWMNRPHYRTQGVVPFHSTLPWATILLGFQPASIPWVAPTAVVWPHLRRSWNIHMTYPNCNFPNQNNRKFIPTAFRKQNRRAVIGSQPWVNPTEQTPQLNHSKFRCP